MPKRQLNEGALGELKRGRKTGHRMWYVLPQLTGLGSSPMSEYYGICSRAEAAAYLSHPILGRRLRESIDALLAHRTASAADILGELDALKFRSCLTLFEAASDDARFPTALEQFLVGQRDARTLLLLNARAG